MSSACLRLLFSLLSDNAARHCYFPHREIFLYVGFPIWRNQNGHLLFHSSRMDPAVWYLSTMFTPADQLSKAHTGEIKQTDQAVAWPQVRNRCTVFIFPPNCCSNGASLRRANDAQRGVQPRPLVLGISRRRSTDDTVNPTRSFHTLGFQEQFLEHDINACGSWQA